MKNILSTLTIKSNLDIFLFMVWSLGFVIIMDLYFVRLKYVYQDQANYLQHIK